MGFSHYATVNEKCSFHTIRSKAMSVKQCVNINLLLIEMLL